MLGDRLERWLMAPESDLRSTSRFMLLSLVVVALLFLVISLLVLLVWTLGAWGPPLVAGLTGVLALVWILWTIKDDD